MSADRGFITAFKTVDGSHANKLVRRLPDGTIEKLGNVEGGSYFAETVAAPTPEAFADILRQVGADPGMTLGLGHFSGAEPGEVVQVWPEIRIAKALGIDPAAIGNKAELRKRTKGWHDFGAGHRVVARLKDSMVMGSWNVLDRDRVRDMPDVLADLDFEDWLGNMCDLVPTLAEAALVMVPSTSRRVLVDGKPWSSKPSWHAFIQVDDPDDWRERVWPQLLTKAFSVNALLTDVPLGFMRHAYSRAGPTVRVSTNGTPWTIVDPTT